MLQCQRVFRRQLHRVGPVTFRARSAFAQQRVACGSRNRLVISIVVLVLKQLSGHRVIQPFPATGTRGVREPRIPLTQLDKLRQIGFVSNLLFVVPVAQHQCRHGPVGLVVHVANRTVPVRDDYLCLHNLPFPLLRKQVGQVSQFVLQSLAVQTGQRPIGERVPVSDGGCSVVAIQNHVVLSWVMVQTADEPLLTHW